MAPRSVNADREQERGQIHKVRFFRTTALVPALIGARDQWTVPRLKGQLARLDLLVLDELGHVPASRSVPNRP